MILYLLCLFSPEAIASPPLQMVPSISSQQTIGVWKFTQESNEYSDNMNSVLQSLEERTRQEILPLLQQHSDLKLITPENVPIPKNFNSNARVLEASRALGLDYVIIGNILDTKRPTLVLKLYHVQTSVLLNQQSVTASNLEGLLYESPPVLDDLLVSVLKKDNQEAPNILVNFDVSPRENTLLFLDGKVVCQTLPCAVKTKQGSHNIQFHNPYYDKWTTDRYLESGMELDAKLKASFGFLNVESTPSGVQFEIDGISMGHTPLLKHKIEKGEHRLTVLDPCYTGKDIPFTIGNNDTERIKIAPIERLAAIEVFLENPTQKAKVYVDDTYVGTTPLSTSVPVCSQAIRVENEFGISEQQLQLRESEVEKLEVRLYKRDKQPSKSAKNATPKSPRAKRERARDRRFNPTHSLWSTYTVQYGLETEEFRLGLGTFQVKNGSNTSFIKPLLPALHAQFVDYSFSQGENTYLMPFGIGYAFDIELGLIQPFYQWHWFTVQDTSAISTLMDIYDEGIYTPNIHKVGVDFMLNNHPFQRRPQQHGGTLQAQASYTLCSTPEFGCKEELYVGASLYLMQGSWDF